MKIEYNENKDYSLLELKKLKEELYQCGNRVIERMHEEEVKVHDYTNKYIHVKGYGYMFVKSQSLESSSTVFLRGITDGLLFSSSRYVNGRFLNFDSMKSWRIPINVFNVKAMKGEILEITKEEFLKKIEMTKEDFLNRAKCSADKLYERMVKWINKNDK